MSADRVELRYVLDQAEIPTFQERDVPDATVLARKRDEVRRAAARSRSTVVRSRSGPRAAPPWPTRVARAGLRPRASRSRSRRRRAARAPWSCATGHSPGAWGGRRSSRGPGGAPRCAPACRRPIPPPASAGTRPTCSAARPTRARRASTCGPGPARSRPPTAAGPAPAPMCGAPTRA